MRFSAAFIAPSHSLSQDLLGKYCSWWTRLLAQVFYSFFKAFFKLTPYFASNSILDNLKSTNLICINVHIYLQYSCLYKYLRFWIYFFCVTSPRLTTILSTFVVLAHQISELEILQQRYREKGLVVLALPSADFGMEHNQLDAVKEVHNRSISILILFTRRTHVIFLYIHAT